MGQKEKNVLLNRKLEYMNNNQTIDRNEHIDLVINKTNKELYLDNIIKNTITLNWYNIKNSNLLNFSIYIYKK